MTDSLANTYKEEPPKNIDNYLQMQVRSDGVIEVFFDYEMRGEFTPSCDGYINLANPRARSFLEKALAVNLATFDSSEGGDNFETIAGEIFVDEIEKHLKKETD